MRGSLHQKALVVLAVGALMLAACKKEQSTSEEGATKSETGTASTESGATQAGRRIAKRYQVESGMVEYALSGTRSGKETLYWTDWGQRESRCTEATIAIMGTTHTSHDCVITLPDVVYTIDMTAKKAMKMNNPAKAFAEGLSDKDLEEFGKRMSENMGMKLVGTDTVAGYSCDLWRTETLETEACTHKGIALRTMTKMMGMTTTVTATKVDLGAHVDESRFALPEGVTVAEAPEIPQEALDAMKKNMNLPEKSE
jgi:hypothetical protein